MHILIATSYVHEFGKSLCYVIHNDFCYSDTLINIFYTTFIPLD